MPPAKRTLIVAAVLLTAAVAVLAVTSYHEIAIHLAPGKRAVTVRAAAALSADSLFWRTFHSGDFDGIPRAAEALTAAYLTTPTDPVTAAHLAWLHNWRMAERARRDSVPATITDDIILARRYFEEAVALDPSDPRTLGFLAGHRLAEGNMHHDERLTRRAYFTMLDAIDAHPRVRDVEIPPRARGSYRARARKRRPIQREGARPRWADDQLRLLLHGVPSGVTRRQPLERAPERLQAHAVEREQLRRRGMELLHQLTLDPFTLGREYHQLDPPVTRHSPALGEPAALEPVHDPGGVRRVALPLVGQ
jgi:hypothetical protein